MMKKLVIVLVLLLSVLSAVAVSASPDWSAPKVVQSCDTLVVKWYDPPVPIEETGPLEGMVWFIMKDGSEKWLLLKNASDDTLEVPIPEDAVSISWGRVWGSYDPYYLGVFGEHSLKCNIVYLGTVYIGER